MSFLDRVKRRFGWADQSDDEVLKRLGPPTSSMPSAAKVFWSDEAWPPQHARTLLMYPESNPYVLALYAPGYTGLTKRLELTCRECGEALSNDAQHCIYCGAEVQP